MNEIVQMTDLTKRFRKHLVLDRLYLEVEEGSIFALLGQNGAGKTTALKILMNLIQASEGHAQVFGHDSRTLSPQDFSQIGYVSENQDVPEWMTVGYFLRYLAPFYPTWDSNRAAELLRQFELPVDRKLKHLSRGMRMKALLASSLAYRPKLIVLDEPFNGLDPLVRDQLIEALLENVDGATVVISSHDLAEIESFASHIGYLNEGRLLFAEEMTTLAARFREVEIIHDQLPTQIPKNWVNLEHSGAVTRFVDTNYSEGDSFAQMKQAFGGSQQISVKPMPLRSIFVTLAKSVRKGA